MKFAAHVSVGGDDATVSSAAQVAWNSQASQTGYCVLATAGRPRPVGSARASSVKRPGGRLPGRNLDPPSPFCRHSRGEPKKLRRKSHPTEVGRRSRVKEGAADRPTGGGQCTRTKENYRAVQLCEQISPFWKDSYATLICRLIQFACLMPSLPTSCSRPSTWRRAGRSGASLQRLASLASGSVGRSGPFRISLLRSLRSGPDGAMQGRAGPFISHPAASDPGPSYSTYFDTFPSEGI